MGTIFISHAREDQAMALQLAFKLEQSDYTTWCYELDSIPGIDHVQQTLEAIEKSDAFVMLISPDCMESHEVTTELTRAQDHGKAVIPLLYRMTHEDFILGRSEWAQRLGNAACVEVDSHDPSLAVSRIIRGLKHLKIDPAGVARNERLQDISAELDRLGVSAEGEVSDQSREGPEAQSAEPPPASGKLRRFPNAGRHVEEVANFVKSLLEGEKLRTQMIRDGTDRIVQGVAESNEGWVKIVKKGLGLEQAVTVSVAKKGHDLHLTIGAGKWMDKAVGGAIGMLIFWPAAVTAGWGVLKQKKLFDRIEREVEVFMSGLKGG